MATTIGHPPGATHCDWCHKSVAWKDTNLTHDNEALCPACWPSWLSIIGTDEADDDLNAAFPEQTFIPR